MAARYTVETFGATQCTATVARTVLSVTNAASGNVIRIIELGFSFDGTSASATPVLIELCTLSTTSGGTSTTHTAQQTGGVVKVANATAKRNYTVEPQTLTVWKPWLCHPQAGMIVQFPLGREPEQPTASYAIALRFTAPATVNCRAYMEWEEG